MINGEKLIEILCNRLEFTGQLCTDNNIRKLLSSLNQYELNQLASFGNIYKWRNEEQTKTQSINPQ